MIEKGTEKFAFKLTTEIPHCRSLWIGILQGTWNEMGIQYGQRCAKDIARHFDIAWKNRVLKGDRPWHKGRSEEERAEYFVAYLRRSFKELSCLSPELIEFLEGIGQGAAKELDKCLYADVCSHFEKIAFLNYSSTKHLHPDWDFDNDRPRTPGKAYDQLFSYPSVEDCNGFWVRGSATKTGETYAMRTAQSKHIVSGGSGAERQVSYVAIPKDPNARIFWGNGRAGNLGGIGGGLINDCGVCCLTSGAQYAGESWKYADETVAPGIRDFLLASYGVVFSKTALEAVERVTVGTERYRELTGRKTVLRARGANIVFADADDAFCIEQNARHFSIRKPGYLGEKGEDYLVIANHLKFEDGSFDENNVFHSNEPIAHYAPEKKEAPSGTYYRFWSGMWMLYNNYGNIDRQMVMEDLVTAHYAYDKEGNRFDPDPDTGFPTVGDKSVIGNNSWHGTFCAHIGPYTKEHPMGMGGNVETSVFNLSTLEVWWVPVWPCHYKQWNMDWNYLDLKPFVEYRKKL